MAQIAMAKKDLQRKRIMKYFIEAAHNLLIEDGIENITARKVADLAGYNSATLYNYFSNLDHLICYASMNYLKAYYAELDDYVEGTDVPREIFMKTWQLFSRHSFENPKIFKLIFFSPFRDELKQMIETYFDIFPENFGEHRVDLIPMLREGDLKKRNMAILSKKLGSEIPEDQLEMINEIMINLYRANLDAMISGEFDTVEDAVSYTMKLIDFALDLSCKTKKTKRKK
jgi:AcrR family transcriptional regulator